MGKRIPTGDDLVTSMLFVRRELTEWRNFKSSVAVGLFIGLVMVAAWLLSAVLIWCCVGGH